MLRQSIALVVIGIFTSTVSFAGGLADKQNAAKAENNLKDGLEGANTACGKKFQVKMDIKSFGEKAAEGGSYCGSVVDGLRSLCGNGADEKAAVAKAVNAITCKFKTGTPDISKGLKLSGTTLEATYDWETGNITDGVKEFLSAKL